MDATVKAQWLAALRSGEYRQGVGALNKDGKFCCLGVLCDLAAKAGVVETEIDPDGYTRYDDFTGSLPPAVKFWSGVKGDFGHLPERIIVNEADCRQLSDLNDSAEASFTQIADIIEQRFTAEVSLAKVSDAPSTEFDCMCALCDDSE